jgi:type II secretory pathway pseudopilin PulG
MRRNRSGTALVLALVVVVVVLGLGAAFFITVIASARQAAAGRELDEAEQVAESGLNLARRFIFVYINQGTWPVNDLLRYNRSFPTDAASIQADALAALRTGTGAVNALTWPEAPVPPDLTTPTTPLPVVFGVHTVFGNGAWYIVARNNPEEADPLVDTDNILILYITGTTRDGRQRQIEARVAYVSPTYLPMGAIVSGGSVKISGDPKITALPGVPSADVVSNGNIEVLGDARIDGKAVASGRVDVRGTPTIRDGILAGVPKSTIPRVDPELYRGLANFVFDSTGVVTDASGLTVGVGRWYNFEFRGGDWRVVSDAPLPPAGVYFFETAVRMTGQATYFATIISKGDIELAGRTGGGGELTLSSYLQNVALLSGGDVTTSGRARVSGFIVSREQMRLGGTVAITEGGLLIADEQDVSGTVRRDSFLGGNLTIEYRDGRPTFLRVDSESLAVVYLRRLR